MSLETEVANLTTQTTALLSAVNVSKATLDQKVTDATTQATNASNSATAADASADAAAASATTATTKAAETAASAASASAIVLGVSTGHPTARPSLNLDFANSQTVDPRITFTRASTATRTNAKGLIESVASGVPRIDYDPITLACKGLLVEEARTNLLTYSQDFDNAAWGKNAPLTVGFANSVVAPNGSLSADVLSTTNAGSVYQDATASGTGTYTASLYAHTSSTCANANITCFFLSNTVETFGIMFNPSTGSLISAQPGVVYSITNCGNGWFRYAITFTGTNASNTFVRFQIYDNTTTANTLVLWGAQLEAGAFPTTYIPSSVTHTGRSSTATFIGSNGLIQTAASGVARYNYNPLNLSCAPALLLEAAATNLLTYSGAVGGTGWTPGAVTVSLNNAMSPDGTTTATLASDVSTSDSPYIDQIISVPNDSGTYVLSMYVKANTAIQTSLVSYLVGGSTPFGTGAYCLYGWASGAYSKAFDAIGGGAIDAGNGWKRLYTVIKNNSTGNTTCVARLFVETSGLSATGSVYVWGAQLEAGSYPTSYIPTVASQVTRAADTSTSASTTRAADVATMTGANFTSWWNATEGTFVAEYSSASPATTGYDRVWSVDDGTNNNLIALLKQNGSTAYYSIVTAGGSEQALFSTTALTAGTTVRTAVAYKVNDFAQSHNGATVVTDTSGTVPVVTKFGFADQYASVTGSHYIRSLRYYPKRLASAELQALTV